MLFDRRFIKNAPKGTSYWLQLLVSAHLSVKAAAPLTLSFSSLATEAKMLFSWTFEHGNHWEMTHILESPSGEKSKIKPASAVTLFF